MTFERRHQKLEARRSVLDLPINIALLEEAIKVPHLIVSLHDAFCFIASYADDLDMHHIV